MEEQTYSPAPKQTGMVINEQMKAYLTEIAKWSYFLAIFGFVGCGLGFVGCLGSGIAFCFMPAPPPALPAAFYFIMSLVYLLYFPPLFYMLRYATRTKVAIATDSEEKMTAAFRSMKSSYKFVGIAIIVSIIVIVLTILLAMTTAAFVGSSLLQM